ncbi:hypothetical protein [Henriciella litoralis]|uniref:hypothetical protein n=1 Tax=Henriciella litoralis TaxID=568102 RepID=UPI0009FB9857|nr:hypothetical protein [Henriciella litoralis]
MMKLFGGFTLVSSKIVATFFMVIILMMLGFAFFPDMLNRLSDFTNWIEGQIRDPDMNDRGKFLFRTLVNENTIFGIIMTLIARAVIEFLFWILKIMWRIANPKKKPEEPDDPPPIIEPEDDVPPTYYSN